MKKREIIERERDGFIQLVSSPKPHQQIALVALDHRTGKQGVIQVETK